MKIESITLSAFKRFKELTISGLPESTKLVVLIGPNGCGKSSLFDAIYVKSMFLGRRSWQPSNNYYDRESGVSNSRHAPDRVAIQFHGDNPQRNTDWKKAVYARSAYRNVPSFQIGDIKKVGTALNEVRFGKMIDNDQATAGNYLRMVSQSLEDAFEKEDSNKTLGEFRENILAEIRDAVKALFPDLILNSLGNPLSTNATFRFDKRAIRHFAYENLSGGEKAAFDLILDLVIKRREYDDTVFCIDEPEAHMSMRIQRKLLSVLYNLIPDNSQLWIATHSIGMMREAYDLYKNNPEKVVFLNFDNRDFDTPQEIRPEKMNRVLWEKMHSIVLEDLAELVCPDVVYLCESTPEKNFDADCYNTIFSPQYPNAKFFSAGSKMDVMRIASILKKAMPMINVTPVRDRDNMAEQEIIRERQNGVRILSRTSIESYLLDDEVLSAFCKCRSFNSNTLRALQEIRDENNNNLKKVAQDIRSYLVQSHQSLEIGDNGEAFMKYSLAPLIKQSTEVYKALEKDIF